MKNIFKKIFCSVAVVGFVLNGSFMGQALAEEPLSLTLMPVRYISVKGDAAKFRAMTWMNDGYTSGIKDMQLAQKVGKDTSVNFEGHAIPGDADYESDLTVIRNNFGYLRLNYGNFQKYYDVYGGYFYPFSANSINRLDSDPKMDIGHFLVELGSSTPNDPGVSLSYERHTRDGIKNSLTWGKAINGPTTKYINPSYESVKLVSDAVTLNANTALVGFDVNAKQKLEYLNGQSYRQETGLPLTTAGTYIQSQAKEPASIQLLSSLKADKWIIDDKTYIAFAYQFQHVKNNELEILKAVLPSGPLTSSGRLRINGGKTSYTSSTWVQNLFQNITKEFSSAIKIKEELITRRGGSVQNTYNTFGLITSAGTTSKMENKTARVGESLSLRYSGIPKTSLYAEGELSQMKNVIGDERGSSTSNIKAVNTGPEGSATVGARYVFNKQLNLTSQLRHKVNNSNYNTILNTDQGWDIGRLHINSDEFSNRISYKPCKWFENSFRFQVQDSIYHTMNFLQSGSSWASTKDYWLKSQALERIYTYNAVFQPLDQWIFDVAYSLDNVKVSTPAAEAYPSIGGIPAYRTNVQTWSYTISYIPKENLSLYSSYAYSWNKNFNSYDYVGLPFGLDNQYYNLSLGVKWTPKTNVTIEPHYGYYSYRANESIDYGNYSAHILWLDAKFDW